MLSDPRAWKRFKANKGALVGAVLVLLVTLIAFVGPFVSPHPPDHQFRETLIFDDGTLAAPLEIEGHWLGADSTGRDELSRLLDGGKVSMIVAYGATAVTVFIGVLFGLISGYFRGWSDTVLMRLVDLLLSLPFLLLAIALKQILGKTELAGLIFIMAALSWTSLARVTRAKVMQVRELEFVQAARALGMSHTRILWKHVLPNVLGPIIVLGTTLVAQMIMFESSLSFLGLGVDPPQASWGSMLYEGQQRMVDSPHLMLLPAIMIVMTVFGFNLFGEGLRDAFDPKD